MRKRRETNRKNLQFSTFYFRRSLPFVKTSHLFNSWNENKPVKIGRDGQVKFIIVCLLGKCLHRLLFFSFQKEIEPRCAEALCRLFPSDPGVDILSIAMKAKRNKKRNSSGSQSRSPIAYQTQTSSSSSTPIDPSLKRQTSKDYLSRRSSPPIDSNGKTRPLSSSDARHRSAHHHRSPPSLESNRHRLDVTLYLIIIRLTYLLLGRLSSNLVQYRTLPTDHIT